MRNTKRNAKILRGVIFNLIFWQMLVEFIRVLKVFDCNFDPTATSTLVFEVIVIVSFMFAMWSVGVVVSATSNSWSKFQFGRKFAVFKLMIITSKASFGILEMVAKNGGVSGYEDVGAKARAAIWSNFITVVVSVILLLMASKLYTLEEYEPLGNQQQVKLNQVESAEDHTVDIEGNDHDDNDD